MERLHTPPAPASAVGILLMAHGSPDHLDDMAAYLQHVRGGRPTPQALVDDIRARYRMIGGRSPLLDLTQAQAQALATRLYACCSQVRVYVGMRHWHPFIREALEHMVADGVRRVVAVSMAPQYSRLSVGAYQQALAAAQAELGVDLDVTCVTSWHDHPLLLQAFAEQVREALALFPPQVRAQVRVIFTAHSLPTRILTESDPYPREVARTAEGVAKLLGLTAWDLAYQSQGATAEAWLGPTLAEAFARGAAQEQRQLLLAPIGFVCDHVEILYDIDILAQQVAETQGLTLKRSASLNTSPLFIKALANVVQSHVSDS
jgi:ferrochelatase